MTPVIVYPEAQDEIDDALTASRAIGVAVAAEFRQAIDDALAAIGTNPAAAAAIPRTICRRYIMTRFPYSLVYFEAVSSVRVVAFAHHRRRSGYWKSRLPRP